MAASTAWQAAAWSRHALFMQARALNILPPPPGHAQQKEGQPCGELQLAPGAPASTVEGEQAQFCCAQL